MNYYASHDAAKARRYHFLLEELMRLCNTVPDTRSHHGRPVEFSLPTLFVLLGPISELRITIGEKIRLRFIFTHAR